MHVYVNFFTIIIIKHKINIVQIKFINRSNSSNSHNNREQLLLCIFSTFRSS
jgi:hypothetical protein